MPKKEKEADLNPFDFLGRWLKYPISFMAMLADWGGFVSGSTSLEFWVPGYGMSKESDIDVYIPAVPKAIEDAVHILNLCGVHWDNFLRKRLDEILEHQMTIIPYWMIYKTALATLRHGQDKEGLKSYLEGALHRDLEPTQIETSRKFVSQFCDACRNCLNEANLLIYEDFDTYFKEMEETIWVFDSDTSRTRKVPSGIATLVHHVVKTLDFLELKIDGKFNIDNDALHKLCDIDTIKKVSDINAIKEEWKQQLSIDRILQIYLNFRVKAKRQQFSRTLIDFIVSSVLDLRERPCINTTAFDLKYHPDFRILHGSLISGQRIQLIIVPERIENVPRVVLQFYATHVMSFMGGTLAAHFYWKKAEKRSGLIMDFSDDQRQGGAEKAIKKYRSRGWQFVRATVEDPMRARSGGDQDTTARHFEKFYRQAHQNTRDGYFRCPKWWRRYFAERKNFIEHYCWQQSRDRITDIHPPRSHPVYGWQLLNWVHKHLDGHAQVAKRTQWRRRGNVKTLLDIWFGGINLSRFPEYEPKKHNSDSELDSESDNKPDGEPDSDNEPKTLNYFADKKAWREMAYLLDFGVTEFDASQCSGETASVLLGLLNNFLRLQDANKEPRNKHVQSLVAIAERNQRADVNEKSQDKPANHFMQNSKEFQDFISRNPELFKNIILTPRLVDTRNELGSNIEWKFFQTPLHACDRLTRGELNFAQIIFPEPQTLIVKSKNENVKINVQGSTGDILTTLYKKYRRKALDERCLMFQCIYLSDTDGKYYLETTELEIDSADKALSSLNDCASKKKWKDMSFLLEIGLQWQVSNCRSEDVDNLRQVFESYKQLLLLENKTSKKVEYFLQLKGYENQSKCLQTLIKNYYPLVQKILQSPSPLDFTNGRIGSNVKWNIYSPPFKATDLKTDKEIFLDQVIFPQREELGLNFDNGGLEQREVIVTVTGTFRNILTKIFEEYRKHRDYQSRIWYKSIDQQEGDKAYILFLSNINPYDFME